MEQEILLSLRVLISLLVVGGCVQMGGCLEDDHKVLQKGPDSHFSPKSFHQRMMHSNDLLDADGESETLSTSFATRPTEYPVDFGGPESYTQMSFFQAIVLAKQEAKCIGSFGSQSAARAAAQTVPVGSTNMALAERFIVIPYGCFRPETAAQCERCRNITARPISNLDTCHHLCIPGDDSCVKLCVNVYDALRNDSTVHDNTHSKLDSLTRTETPRLTESSSTSFEDSVETNVIRVAAHNVPIKPQEKMDSSGEGVGRSSTHISGDYAHLMSPSRPRTRLIHSPQVFCEGVNKVNKTHAMSHFVILRWNINDSLSSQEVVSTRQNNNRMIPLNSSQDGNSSGGNHRDNHPLVFVIEERTGTSNQWKTIGKTPFCLLAVNVSYLSETYRWRITAVGPNGIEDIAVTDLYTTLNGYKKPGPPKKIYVVDSEAKNANFVNVLIGWEPPDVNRTCVYKIVLDVTTTDGRPHSVSARIKDPLGVHMKWFEDLKFGTNYDVLMTSRNPSGEDGSAGTTLKFTTPTCLQSFHYRFDMCAPPSPRSINASFERIRVHQKYQIHVTITWLPPLHASDNNPVDKYVVDVQMNIFSLSNPKNFTSIPKENPSAFTGLTSFNKEVPGNETRLVVGNLRHDTEYTVMITAYSIRGRSPVAQYHFSTKLASKPDLSHEAVGNWIYVTATFIIAFLLLLFCNVIRVLVHKRNVKIARNQYFKSMEERDEMGADWSIVPLTDDSSKWKLFDENFPKEKWEISWDDLTMGEVIGQGAFGVVRRAKIQTHKLETKLKFRGEDEIWFKSADRSVDKNEPGMETVAVKMVKVSSIRDDREQLIKEITMMQSLGFHSQIVGLLGACTKGRTLCLVLEYCPGGDLLTFVRKVRAKYWPTLGLSHNSPSSSKHNSKATGLKFCTGTNGNGGTGQGSSSISSNSETRKSVPTSPINYADIGGFSASSSSPEEFCSPGTNENENGSGFPTASRSSFKTESKSIPTPSGTGAQDEFEDDDEFRPIDEKDVLSYARQIAMGMEYLEKNRVVHRDLACRNVLLMGDYKHVKISDFGLSRDIYTWNVYHQKSNGKLPIKWMAIESIFTHIFTTKSDVWSYGILLWELVTLGGQPYPGLGNTELFHLLKSGYRMERPDNCSEELFAVMKKCWRTAAASRPSFTELRRHIETMMEAAEPNLYLSLMADLPADFFQLSSRSDLHMIGKEEEVTTPFRDSPFGTSASLLTSRNHNNSFTSNGNGTVFSDYGSFKSNRLASTSSHSSSRRPNHKPQTFYHNTSFRNEVFSEGGDGSFANGSKDFDAENDGNQDNCSTSSHKKDGKLRGEVKYKKRIASPISSSTVNGMLHSFTTAESEDIELQPVGNNKICSTLSSPPRYSFSASESPTNKSTKEDQVKILKGNGQVTYYQNKEDVPRINLFENRSAGVQSPDSGILIQRGEHQDLIPEKEVLAVDNEDVDEKSGSCEETSTLLTSCSIGSQRDVNISLEKTRPHVKNQAPGSPTKQGLAVTSVTCARPKLTLPFVNINDMTIIENRTYDIRDT